MKTTTRYLAAILLLAQINPASAALISRLSGAAYYDDALDVTWLADANLAASNTFGVSGINPGGSMAWDKANEWIAAMNNAGYQGASDWRLPTIVDTGSSGCNWGYSETDCGYNVQTATGATVFSEMAHLFYTTLGNTARYDTNPGPFTNLLPNTYWSGNTYSVYPTSAWTFGFGGGGQGDRDKSSTFVAMALRSGDIATVPLPASLWIMGSALGLLGLVRRQPAAITA